MKKNAKIILTGLILIVIILVCLIDYNYVKFDNDNIVLNVGETKNLNVKTSYKNYYCFSDNNEIVRVINMCDIVANDIGSANITVNAGYKSDNIVVNVIDGNEKTEDDSDEEINNDSDDEIEENQNEKENNDEKIYFNFSEKNKNLVVGENINIKYSTNYKGNIKFKTSNNNIIIKDNVIYANKKGNSTIIFDYDGLYETMDIIIKGKKVTATFDNSNIDVSYSSMDCIINEVNSKCSITLPNIYVNDNYRILGFKKENDNAIYNINSKVSISRNETFYAVIQEKERITVNYNGNGSYINKKEDFCYEDTCLFVLPNIVRDNYKILGYSDNPNATYAKYKVGDTVSVSNNITLYAITSRELIATFHNDDKITIDKPSGNWEYISDDVRTTCVVYNNQDGCYIFMPTRSLNENDYKLVGFKSDKFYNKGSNIYITEKTRFFPVSEKNNDILNSDINLYVSSSGSDDNIGLYKNYPVKSLSKVQNILKNLKDVKNVVINIESGNYYGENVLWSYYNQGYSITFKSSGNAIYTASNSILPWFIFTSDNTSLIDINFKFENITLNNYYTGISISGGSGLVKNITFNNMVFNNIGSESTNVSYSSKQAISLRNTRFVDINNCRFYNLLNKNRDHVMAAIRLNKSLNVNINNNSFVNVDGDVIVFENGSSGNYVASNSFINSGYHGYVVENLEGSYAKSLSNKIYNNKFSGSFLKNRILESCIIENKTIIYYYQNNDSFDKNFYNNIVLNKLNINEYKLRFDCYDNIYN